MASKLGQVFSVKRQSPELIVPARPTPREVKQISDINDQESLRFLAQGRAQPEAHGRLHRFIEANANSTLEMLGDAIEPPCPYLDDPQLPIVVNSRFIVALRLNHIMCNAPGLFQFLKTIKEMICGADQPSLMPVWQRNILNARAPQVSCFHHEYNTTDIDNLNDNVVPTVPMDHKSFNFGPKEIINVRGKQYNMQLPPGYYGNAFAFLAACSKAGLLTKNPLGYAVELVKQANAQMSEEYIRSVADLMVITGQRSRYVTEGNFIVSDTTRSGFAELDLGWGQPLYDGPAGAVSLISFYMKYQKSEGKNGIVVPICLPLSAVKRFEEEIKKMIQGPIMKNLHIKEPNEMLCKL
ncbi:hypothetical protein JRO89_XS10G0080800 [Xanthoceras sorbifolium]|uniref:Benzyl alcohol O-benzoyltransferase n=1 Tax=Xanthoceras sorbifolium TaxID=99658 RepID=A0ABQ8HI24_9ROSI|nr:hypothetical protein JRO89_XS10G0080800 [Xanthoceras sorbifolium]